MKRWKLQKLESEVEHWEKEHLDYLWCLLRHCKEYGLPLPKNESAPLSYDPFTKELYDATVRYKQKAEIAKKKIKNLAALQETPCSSSCTSEYSSLTNSIIVQKTP